MAAARPGVVGGGDGTTTGAPSGKVGAPADEGGKFVAQILGDTEDTWTRILQQAGHTYRAPTLVLFNGSTSSACGFASAASGPFYCPNDQKLYIDLAFYDELKSKFGAPGDFAEAYVIAHEVGHHVQNLLGILPKVDSARRNASEEEANALSVRLELQADCFAGVWGHEADQEGILDPGDIDEALNCRRGDRRRHAAEARPGLRRARKLHPRHLRAAPALVQARLRPGQDRRLRHFRREPGLDGSLPNAVETGFFRQSPISE